MRAFACALSGASTERGALTFANAQESFAPATPAIGASLTSRLGSPISFSYEAKPAPLADDCPLDISYKRVVLVDFIVPISTKPACESSSAPLIAVLRTLLSSRLRMPSFNRAMTTSRKKRLPKAG